MVRHEFILKPSAVRDLDRIRKHYAVMIADGIEEFLTHNPTRESKSRIKRLRGIQDPDYRLLLGEYRIFYNVDEAERRVEVLRILHKGETHRYYEEARK
ncbi:MAG: type II toxin-antitoxin system RelE/ParE family toxin [Candidatus Sumerlaeota bacterium]|nr:type II toxin-antitoxin system RelE/ParE family toxin [Candidatus Sumerlaeota bacterium]